MAVRPTKSEMVNDIAQKLWILCSERPCKSLHLLGFVYTGFVLQPVVCVLLRYFLELYAADVK
nr:hypothetical protein [Ferrimicrobium acidiphilum]